MPEKAQIGLRRRVALSRASDLAHRFKVLEIDSVLDPHADYGFDEKAPWVQTNTVIKAGMENAIEAFVSMTATELALQPPFLSSGPSVGIYKAIVYL